MRFIFKITHYPPNTYDADMCSVGVFFRLQGPNPADMDGETDLTKYVRKIRKAVGCLADKQRYMPSHMSVLSSTNHKDENANMERRLVCG